MTRKALGRGLSALLQEVEGIPPSGIERTGTQPAAGSQPGTQPEGIQPPGLQEVAIDLIDPNPFQPRRAFAETSLNELAASIRSTGVVQPVLLRPSPPPGERYQLVAGERRWRAAALAGLRAVPAVVRDLTDRDALELALTENLLREDLNPLEVAVAYEGLHSQFHLSHEEIAARLGVNRSTVTNTLRLLKLPPSVQTLIREGALTAGHARALLGLDSAEDQVRLAELIVSHDVSVRQTEKMVAARAPETAEKPPVKATRQDPNTRAAILEMERALGTRVRINGNSERGKIEISYFSTEDLSRIYDHITSNTNT